MDHRRPEPPEGLASAAARELTYIVRSLLLLVAMLGCRGKPADDASSPVITITAQLDGANAETVERELAMPIEQAMNGLPGLRAIESRSRADVAIVRLELDRSADVERATHDVRHALAGVQARLPRATLPPALARMRRDDRPILWLALGGTLSVTELSSYARRNIVSVLQRVPGVGKIDEHGLAQPAIIIRPDLVRVAAINLPTLEVLAPLQAAEVGQVEALGDLVIGRIDEAPIRLRDVATIEEGFERAPDAKPALAIYPQYNAKRDIVLAAVRDEIRKLEPPPGVTVTEASPPTAARPPPSLVVRVLGDEREELDAIADDTVEKLAGLGITDVVRDPAAGEWEQTVLPDRDRALELGVSLADIFATVRAVTREGRVTIGDASRSLVVKLATPALPLDMLLVRGRDGAMIPLSAIATLGQTRSGAILRHNGARAIVLSVYAPTASLAAARKLVKQRAVPAGYRITISP